MAIYNISKPQFTNSKWAYSIMTRIIFPPVLIWDLLKLSTNWLVGGLVGQIVLPAQNKSLDYIKINNPSSLDRKSALTHTSHTVITHDGAELDTLEITHESQKNLSKELQKYIINFVGNDDFYESHMNRKFIQCDDAQLNAVALQSNVVGFNYRGVGQSTGQPRSKDDLVTDGIAQVQRLLNEGVSSKNITLYGHSLGGSVASLVAQYFHGQGHPINLFNDRSFSSTSNFIVGQIRLGNSETGHEETLGGKILGWIAIPFIKLGLALVNWEINAGAAYKEIPTEYKDYMVVRSNKENRNSGVIDDRVIPHYSSIHAYLKSDRQTAKQAIINAEKPRQDKNKDEELIDLKRQFQQHKMSVFALGNQDGHSVNAHELKNRFKTTGAEHFRKFFKEASADHGITPQNPPIVNVC